MKISVAELFKMILILDYAPDNIYYKDNLIWVGYKGCNPISLIPSMIKNTIKNRIGISFDNLFSENYKEEKVLEILKD